MAEPWFVHTTKVKDNPYERPLLVIDSANVNGAWRLLVRLGNPEATEDILCDVPAHQAQPCMIAACSVPGCHILRELDRQTSAANAQRIRQGVQPLTRQGESR